MIVYIFFLLLSLLRCDFKPAGLGRALGEYTDVDSLKHKMYFGHTLEQCESTPGEFHDYDPYSLAFKEYQE